MSNQSLLFLLFQNADHVFPHLAPFLVPITQMALSGSVYTTVALTVSQVHFVPLGYIVTVIEDEKHI